MATCTVAGCCREATKKGWCEKHYMRWYRYGNPKTVIQPKGLPLKERWLSYVRRTDACWEWFGARHPRGYGTLNVDGRSAYAHRIGWELFRGEIPKGLHVLHKCDNPNCVNPLHLFLGTHAENMGDMVTKGRSHLKRRNGIAKGEIKWRPVLS